VAVSSRLALQSVEAPRLGSQQQVRNRTVWGYGSFSPDHLIATRQWSLLLLLHIDPVGEQQSSGERRPKPVETGWRRQTRVGWRIACAYADAFCR